ncbi:AAA domain-containing protein [Pseudarthrobacter sp. H3Y2-7]|uniref:AAA domain-containing protein n=1 Tax=Pseudarthrobacter naphthalenicus TaxID=3031328 RepID=UPI0023B172F4|nr:AAA domain-containing protein [Pseudarthrobacter sp. H3Y2-7]MDE8667406.1 AAA domain-containing protein [Pseudarthrobacter sp. H3Y2-7]
MTDPRREAILIRRQDQSGFDDKTPDVIEYAPEGDFTSLTFRVAGGRKKYSYSARKVLILRNPQQEPIGEMDGVSVRGRSVQGVTEVWRFQGSGQTWWRVFSSADGRERYQTCRLDEISIMRAADPDAGARDVLHYWRDVVSHLGRNDPLRPLYQNLERIPHGSVLSLYLNGENPAPPAGADELILPFSSNLSQREALRKGLSHRISVIDGPPGTGKTQTILNLVANIISSPGQTVGIVSFNNAAVENVRDKLANEGFGHVVADLRRSDVRRGFFEGQHPANVKAQRLAGGSVTPMPAAGRISDLDGEVQRLQALAGEAALLRQELDAFRLERRHFSLHVEGHQLPRLPALKLLRLPAIRILEFLAETAAIPEEESLLSRLFRQFKTRFRYGSTRDLDPQDTDVVLRLQAAYYDNKIAELERTLEAAEERLAQGNQSGLEDELKHVSRQALEASLHQRYAGARRQDYSNDTYLQHFTSFAYDYPVILSTCHSLRRSIPSGFMLDYLIIDEASQVDLLAAGLALSCARNVIIVGDLRQLPHIPDRSASGHARPAPAPGYDYGKHSILSSVVERFGGGLPRTMLREHYRCDPAIIDFCNRKFYGGQLVPYTVSDPGSRALVVVSTARGNHMRQHPGGRTNQREAEVIAREVLTTFCSGTEPGNIGVVTPYRRQVDKVAEALQNTIESALPNSNTIEADTVHKFQGREKDIIIMSTVLDETKSGRSGIEFVDNPQLVNVAVSRAVKRFVLVTNHQMLPASRHLRDLVRFIQYQDPGNEVFDSAVLSVFDLLYKDYAAALRPLAARLQNSSRFASENIVWTLLLELLAEEAYEDFAVAQQVVLRNLLPDLSRLTSGQVSYVRNRATVDFVVYNRITNMPVLAVEVDGFAFHEADARQTVRDGLKDAICRAHGIPLLRLPTTGSGEEQLIRRRLATAILEKESR